MTSSSLTNRVHGATAIIALSICCAAASSGVVSAGVVTFEDLPRATDYSLQGIRVLVPSVDGFRFTSKNVAWGNPLYGWSYYNPNSRLDINPAYRIGAIGTTAIVTDRYDWHSPDAAYMVSRADGSLWSFEQAVFTGLSGPGTLRLVGSRGGIEVFNFTCSISNAQQTVVSMSSGPDSTSLIDTLTLTNYSPMFISKNFIMDDLQYALPSPGVLAMMGSARFWARRRRSRG